MTSQQATSAASHSAAAFGSAFFFHGGGPMPLLPGEDPATVRTLKEGILPLIAPGGAPPSAIIVVSAHYQKQVPHVLAAAKPKMIYDYDGFPPETYAYQYPASGQPDLARRIVESMKAIGLTHAVADETWGFDHGTFVPLTILFPEAQIPVVAVSVLTDDEDAARHLALGEALQPFVAEGAVVLGSGASFHNFDYFFSDGSLVAPMAFDETLRDTLTNPDYDAATRKATLLQWRSWTHSYVYHPRGGADHFLPLLVTAAAAKYQQAGWSEAKTFNGTPISSFAWRR